MYLFSKIVESLNSVLCQGNQEKPVLQVSTTSCCVVLTAFRYIHKNHGQGTSNCLHNYINLILYVWYSVIYINIYIHNNYIITTYNYIQTTQNRVL